MNGIAPRAEWTEIVSRARTALNVVEMVGALFSSARGRFGQLEATVLAKAFRGELVPQDPSDEPASVLLDRIKSERKKREEAEPKTRTSRREPKVA